MLCCYAYSRQSCVDDLWIVIPMFRTWEQWAMVDWSTAFHGQKMRWTPTGFDTYLFSNINYAPGTLRPHMCCARVFFPLCSRNLPNIQIRSNQSIRPEQFSINWNRPKLPLHIQKYPGISGNKEYVNPHVSKNMHPIMPARNHPQNSGSHQVPNITQAQRICSLLPNLTPETTPKYLVYPIIPWHNIPQEHLLF